MIRPRIIPLLLLDGDKLIKTISFANSQYIGDPINAIRIFNEKEVDEICILDKFAYKNGINYKLLKELAEESFMPLSYGGGIKSKEEAIRIIAMGYEKIILNEICYKNPELISELASELGSQSVVVSIDYTKNFFKNEVCCYRSCKTLSQINPIKHAINMVNLGAGEILLTSVKNEGKMLGFDYDIISKLTKELNVPIIAHGGCGHISHIKKVIHDCGANAVALGSMVVYFGENKGILINYPDLKSLLNMGVYKHDKM